MNTQRLVVLGLALVAAGGAAFLVRAMLGGGTPAVEAKPSPQVAMSEVLVASANLQPGQALGPDQVRWEKWPASAVDRNFITHSAAGSIENAVKGTVVRSPIAEGQPVARGQAVGTIETTKATIDVAADRDGYLFPLAAPGDEAPVGAPIAAIAATPERPALREGARAERPAAAPAESAVITAKARPLLERHGLTAADFPGLAVIRMSDVEQLLARRPASAATRPRRFRGEDLDPKPPAARLVDNLAQPLGGAVELVEHRGVGRG